MQLILRFYWPCRRLLRGLFSVCNLRVSCSETCTTRFIKLQNQDLLGPYKGVIDSTVDRTIVFLFRTLEVFLQ